MAASASGDLRYSPAASGAASDLSGEAFAQHDPAAEEFPAGHQPHSLSKQLLCAQPLAVYDPKEAARREEQTAREQAELNMIKAAVGSVFSVRKPRDCVAGTSSGLKTMARGVGIGFASLVVQPYIGAKSSGAKGFMKGIGSGVATCAATTVAGTVIGSGQIVRGLVNTPGAIVQKARGQVWNSELRTWEKDWYSLPEEAAEVLGANGGSSSSSAGFGGDAGASEGPKRLARKVADTELYDLLGAKPEATEAELRRAFYKKSLALHPDKNPDNPEATAQFQAVTDAYRVLGDEGRRRVYDEHGKDSSASALPKIEPMVFFAALFGTHHFETYIGRLRLAQDIDGDLQSIIRDIVAVEDEEGPQLDALKVSRAYQRMKALERERQVKCAVTLAERLQPVVGLPETEREAAFQKWEADFARSEASHLAQAPVGPEMLYLIGWMYINGAQQFFAGSVVKRMLAAVEAKVHLAKTKGSLATAAGRTYHTVNGIMKTAEKKKKSLGAKPSSDEPIAKEAEADIASKQEEGQTGVSSSAGLSENSSSESCSEARPAGHAAPGHGGTFNNPPVEMREEQPLAPGTVVVLCGLRSNPELNDEVGIIECHDPEVDRYVIHLLSDLGARKLKRDNLIVIEDPSGPTNSSGSGGASSSSVPSPQPAEGSQEGQGEPGDKGWAPGGEEAEMADAFKDTMPLFHDTLWNVTALDIEFTLAKVIRKVLRDMSVDKTIRQGRAEAMLRLGKIFQEPLIERKKEGSKADGMLKAQSSESSAVGEKDKSRSVLARFKPSVRWRSSKPDELKAKEAKVQGEKQKQMEAAMALMAAGATTEDVDEMMAARAAMEAEFGSDFRL